MAEKVNNLPKVHNRHGNQYKPNSRITLRGSEKLNLSALQQLLKVRESG
jgi:hypothetical protein